MFREQGRRSAIAATPILALNLFLSCVTTEATTYTMGDSSGWTFNVESWTKGKKFKAGDIFVFNYDPSLHNVAVVDANGYKSYKHSSRSQAYSSGKDQLKLSKGSNYFIYSIPSHCDGGLKLVVNTS